MRALPRAPFYAAGTRTILEYCTFVQYEDRHLSSKRISEGRRITAGSANMAQQDRREITEHAIRNISGLLNQHQMRALSGIELSGWRVFCVRTSLFQDPLVVVVNAEGDAFATLEYDGELNFIPDLTLRKDDLRSV